MKKEIWKYLTKVNKLQSIFKIILLTILFINPILIADDQSNDLRISTSDNNSSGCNLAVAGFDTKEQFLSFFEKLKKAASQKDKKALSELMHYPLNTFAKNYPKSIKNKKIFIKDFDKVMSTKLLDLIQNQEVEKIFCKSDGVMLGNGEVWINVYKKQVLVTTLTSN